MGRAFEASQGDLAEKLFAALKAGDDSRGKQSASMLVVGKSRGRNINNDRLIYINVDDSPAPIRELRRLLDMNLGMLYSQWMGCANYAPPASTRKLGMPRPRSPGTCPVPSRSSRSA